ncbi:hypothetical protein [Marmoricola endophyticus]|uniref:hypothetical protein n=1 Tax=Marmoricola endophyticus TaxID=2040280 RepID=UPI001667FEA7|nr:hypothetical protein [Marmoricola endophyticus]
MNDEPDESSRHSAGEDGGPEVGSVGEEAVKLLGALSQWAREQSQEQGRAAHAVADHVADAARDVDAHLATDSAECRWCPVCRVVHAVRQTSPEVRDHLVSAAGSLLEAAAGLLATHVPQEGRTGPGPQDGVEHIDLGSGSEEDWDVEDDRS